MSTQKRLVRISMGPQKGVAVSNITFTIEPQITATMLKIESLKKFKKLSCGGFVADSVNFQDYDLFDGRGHKIDDGKFKMLIRYEKNNIQLYLKKNSSQIHPALPLIKEIDIKTNLSQKAIINKVQEDCNQLRENCNQLREDCCEEHRQYIDNKFRAYEQYHKKWREEIEQRVEKLMDEKFENILWFLENKRYNQKISEENHSVTPSQIHNKKQNSSTMVEQSYSISQGIQDSRGLRLSCISQGRRESISQGIQDSRDLRLSCISQGRRERNLPGLELSPRSCLSSVFRMDGEVVNDDTNARLTFQYKGYEIGCDGIRKISDNTFRSKILPNIKVIDMKVRICGSDLAQLVDLGKGQSGSVRKVLHFPTFSYLAIKKISTDKEENRNQIVHELDAFRAIGSSPYVVSFHGAYMHSDRSICLAMEYMDCSSLKDFVDEHDGKLPEYITRHVAFHVVNGLKHFHDSKVLHRDIKPDNILVHHNGAIKITDFGLLKVLNGRSRTSTYKGTKAYMSPERLDLKPYNIFSEIWSFGLCVVYCAKGNIPYTEISEWNLLSEVLKGYDLRTADPKKEKFSDEICSFVSGCLHLNPTQRSNLDNLLNHEFLNSGDKPDLVGSVKWTNFCKMNPCIEEELDIILGHAACELVNLSNSNISEPVDSKFEDMIKKLVKMTHHTSDKVRTKLSKKRDEIVFSQGIHAISRPIEQKEKPKEKINDIDESPCSVHSTNYNITSPGHENTTSPGNANTEEKNTK